MNSTEIVLPEGVATILTVAYMVAFLVSLAFHTRTRLTGLGFFLANLGLGLVLSAILMFSLQSVSPDDVQSLDQALLYFLVATGILAARLVAIRIESIGVNRVLGVLHLVPLVNIILFFYLVFARTTRESS